jgi:hypothetical protein
MALSATSQSFTYNGNGAATPTSQTITFTANPQNLSGTTVFTATKFNSAGASIGSPSLGGSGNTRTLAIADFDPAAYCTVSANLSGYQDNITVVRLQDGTSTVVGVLTNEAVTVAADNAGTVVSFANAGGNFIVYQGITDVTSSSTFSVASSSGVTISINAGGVYTVSAMSALQGTATLRAVYNSITIDRVYNISKSLGGSTGAPGAATFVITRVANDSSAPTDVEVNALLGRNPVAGDICTLSYNNSNNAVVYRYVTSWALFVTYITGSLIVQNTITADKISATTIFTNALQVGLSGNLPVISGTSMTGAGGYLYSDGKFAFGNSNTNIVFDGATAYINGFTARTTASGGNIAVPFGTFSIPNAATLASFAITKPSLAVLSFDGFGQIIVDPAIFSTIVAAQILINIAIHDPSNNIVWQSAYDAINGVYVTVSAGGTATSKKSDFVVPKTAIFQMVAGTYSIKVYADTPSNYVYNSSGVVAVPEANRQIYLRGGIIVYQAQV